MMSDKRYDLFYILILLIVAILAGEFCEQQCRFYNLRHLFIYLWSLFKITNYEADS